LRLPAWLLGDPWAVPRMLETETAREEMVAEPLMEAALVRKGRPVSAVVGSQRRVVEYSGKRRGQSELNEVCKVVEVEAQRMCCSRFDQASPAVYRHLAGLRRWLCSVSLASRRVVVGTLGNKSWLIDE